MYLDTAIYSPDNLNQMDKKINDELTEVKNDILNTEVLDEYLEEKYENAAFTAQLVKEHLEPFVEYLKKRFDYCICDRIIDSIESYSDEEYEAIVRKIEYERNKSNEDSVDKQVERRTGFRQGDS